MAGVSDDERRRVARRLREKKAECEERGYPWMCDDLLLALGYEHGYEAGDEIFDVLADLIEPARGQGGRTILCAHCEKVSWCGCEPGDEEGGCDFEPSVTEGEPPYNLYSLYEAVLKRRPRDECAIDDDEVDELVDALLDICNSPGHELIQRSEPPYPDATASYRGWRAEVYDPDGVLVSPSSMAAYLVRAHADGKVPSESKVRCVAEAKVDGERLEKLAHDAAVKLTGIDRDALLALADGLEFRADELIKAAQHARFSGLGPTMERAKHDAYELRIIARRIREALGVSDDA